MLPTILRIYVKAIYQWPLRLSITYLLRFFMSFVNHHRNLITQQHDAYPSHLKTIINAHEAKKIHQRIAAWPGYKTTPLHSLDKLSQAANVNHLFYKDESARFQLKSFKALGGAYAVECLLLREVAVQSQQTQLTTIDLEQPTLRKICRKITVTTATDGNHGRSVAWGAQRYGCQCVIYIHAGVSRGREQALQDLGATVIRCPGNYDDSVRQASHDADTNGWHVVSDTTYPGYTSIPRDVMAGYTVMLSEIVTQLEPAQIPTHVFIQGGVGALAAAVIGYLWDYYQINRPRFIMVEPHTADCLYQSARAGRLMKVNGTLETMMAGLACGEVSILAWEIISAGCDDFLTINDSGIETSMRELHRLGIEAGESAVPGLAALLDCARRPSLRQALQISDNSRILLLGTEGATDLDIYQQIIAGHDTP